MPEWNAAFQDLPREHGFEPLRVEGVLPRDLSGTLFRNGAALFSLFGRRYRHWFDGDGAVSAVRFADGGAAGAVRLVRTPELEHERRAGRALYGVIGTPGRGWRRLGFASGKNPANTSVFDWQGRIFALCEGGLPVEISPSDITTVGQSSLGGVLGGNFTAHPHYVAAHRSWFGFGLQFGVRCRLLVFALPESGPARRLACVRLPFPTLLHDFIPTERHLVFFVSPVRARWLPFLSGVRPFLECLEWDPGQGTEVIVLPLSEPERAVRFATDAFYQWHFANAFERGDELVVDFVRYPDFESIHALRRLVREEPGAGLDGALCRAVLVPSSRRLRVEQVWPGVCEFPRIAPGREGADCRFVYLAAYSNPALARTSIYDVLAKVDLQTGRTEMAAFGQGWYPSEPVFIPRPGTRAEDDGYVTTLVYDARAHRSGVAVLDAVALAAGPLAIAWFDHHIPPTFHGVFRQL